MTDKKREHQEFLDEVKKQDRGKTRLDKLTDEHIQQLSQIRELRKTAVKRVFGLLWGELGLLALLIVFQGFNFWGFNLNEWVFGIFANAVLVQTFVQVGYINKYLFSERSDKFRLRDLI